MPNLFYPQLASGAVAQYPIRKTHLVRTIKNILPDGSMFLYADAAADRRIWQLSYTDLPAADLNAIQAHFAACAGPLHAFTFIDPTDNMLTSSSDLTATAWQASSLLAITPGAANPDGASMAFTITNNAQATLELSQTLNVPAYYQYCFSAYVVSAQPTTVTLIRRGPSLQANSTVPVGTNWTRIVSSGQLSDSGVGFSVAISLAAGQQLGVYGPQLEAQIAPSRYRPTLVTGGVYTNAHFLVDQLPIVAQAPDQFSTSFSIEAAI